jgi:hypothetical protein
LAWRGLRDSFARFIRASTEVLPRRGALCPRCAGVAIGARPLTILLARARAIVARPLTIVLTRRGTIVARRLAILLARS